MFSTNGRVKKDKESASNVKKNKHVITCLDCKNKMYTKSKEFGEELVCDKCQSKNLNIGLDE